LRFFAATSDGVPEDLALAGGQKFTAVQGDIDEIAAQPASPDLLRIFCFTAPQTRACASAARSETEPGKYGYLCRDSLP
jgi:hypothetical protein